MRFNFKKINFFLTFLIGILIIIFTASFCFSENDESENKYIYHQKSISKVIEKDLKIKIAISTFEDNIKIKDSLFNVKKNKNKDIPIDIKDSEVKIKINKIKQKENKTSKNELLTGLLVDAFHKTDRFKIIERSNINELIREINFQQTKWVKSDNVKTLGNVYGIQYIVLAGLLQNEEEKVGQDYYTLALRMCDVGTGEIISSSISNETYLSKAVDIAVRKLAEKVKSKPWKCKIVGIGDSGIYINAGFGDNLKKGDKFYISRIKKEIIDPETKEKLGKEWGKIAVVKITEVLDNNLSKVEIQKKFDNIQIGDFVLAEKQSKEKDSEMEKWENIFGKIDNNKLDKYSYDTYDFSPEDIINKYGNAVLKIQTDIGLGSGFVVSSDGKIVTNFHVVKDANNINVKIIKQNRYTTGVKVIKTIPEKDLALLKMNNVSNILPVKLGNSDEVRIGERIVAIGNPGGLENTISDGLISGIRESKGIKLLQMSAPATHGSSGGPVVNKNGEVVGVVFAGFEEKGNINFAIPINYVKQELLN